MRNDLWQHLPIGKQYPLNAVPLLTTRRYPVSKAIEVLFVRELVKHTGNNPIITLVNPGLCGSDLMREASGPLLILVKIMMMLLARTTEKGSRTLVAGVSTGEESHGEYMADCKNQEVAGWVTSPRGVEVQKKVYDQTMAILEKIEPGISKNL